ncbi:MAG TPA: non-homologous end-joining DNA ligase [Acidimicrobiia bacterium]|nr:non-homologous end-joining DNA ligase [Acidimicrobiia bacterium]
MSDTISVDVDGRLLSLSNLTKVLYPGSGSTKADVIEYYRRVAPVMLPHLRGRAPTLVRAPDGVRGEVFFEKRRPPHAPEWVPSAVVGRYDHHQGYEAGLVDDLPTLVWVANLAALELHTHQARVTDPEHPTAAVIDLDPGAPAGMLECCAIALSLHDVCEQLGLVVVVKSSGGKGLHLSVPLNNGASTADDTKRFALALGQLLESRVPDRVTTTMAKAARPGKVFVDWSQNDRAKTTVCAYSLRIGERPTVSAPLTWDEVQGALDAREPERLVFEASEVLARVAEHGDLFAPNLIVRQELPTF